MTPSQPPPCQVEELKALVLCSLPWQGEGWGGVSEEK